MNKLTETFFGLCGVAAFGVAVWLGFTDGTAPALVFYLIATVFLGGVAIIAEKIGNALDKVFGPSAK